MTYRTAPQSQAKSVRLSIVAPSASIVVFTVCVVVAIADRRYARLLSFWPLAAVALSGLLLIADTARWLSSRREIAATLAALNEGTETDTSPLVDEQTRADTRSTVLRWALAVGAVALYLALYAGVGLIDYRAR